MIHTLGSRIMRRGVAATAVAFAVAGMIAAPASAHAVVGGGSLFGTVSFTNGTSIPTLTQDACNSVTWQFSTGNAPAGLTAGAFLDLGGNAFAGFINISATGSNTCEFGYMGNGPLSVSYVFGTNATGLGTFSCNTMTGSYTRIANVILLGVNAPCYVTGAPEGTVIANTVGVLQPTVGDGVTKNITQAAFIGAWNAVNPNP